MKRTDTARVLANPGNRVGAGFDTGADIELEGNGLVGVLSQDVHGALAVDGMPFGVMVVVAGGDVGFLELLVAVIEGFGDLLPAIDGFGIASTSKNDVARAEDAIEIHGLVDAIRRIRFQVIVGGKAFQTQGIELRANGFGVIRRPFKVSGVKLNALVTLLGDGIEGGGKVALQLIAH